MTRTPGEYVYHAGYLPRGLESVKSKGLIPSRDGYSGPGVYFAYEPDEGFYHVDAADATMFRVRWSDLVNRFGVYPQKPDGIQRDDNEIIVPGAVPASMLEVEYFPGEWWDIASAVAADRGPPMNEALLVTDVPREEWLEDKIAYAKKRGRDSFGVPYMGSTTGYVRQPSHVVLPVSVLARIPGARGEQRNIRHDDLKAIMQIMKDTGKLPLNSSGQEYVPFICVAWNGEPWVMEGNHRIMSAERLGWDTLPVELKYFDGGERVKSGLLYPGKIGLTDPTPGSSITMNEQTIKLGKTDAGKAREFIDAVYTRYPHTFQNNHVMSWGSGEEQEISMFELVPSFGKPNAVEIKWIQAYPLRKGVGSRAMKELQGMAQEHGVSLTLFPWDKGRVSQAKLMKFYRRHGFQPTVKGAKNMIWHPEVAEASLATMRDYFNQVDGPTNVNRTTARVGKNPAGIPQEIQTLVNKMYHSGKISPQEYEILRRFQQQTKINVMGIKEAETGTAYARDISKEFRKLGYSKIGSGADSTIWAKDASHVIKILMPEDAGSRAVEVFKKFYEFCKARQDIPCLPVFNEYNTIDVLDKEYIQIDMERLYPVKKNTFEEAMIWYLSDYVANGAGWKQVKQELSDPHPWINSHWPSKANKLAQTVQELSSQDESAWNLLYSVMAMLYKTGRINKLGWDLHTENVMRRSNGQLVIIDPWFADASLINESVDIDENFADGRKPGRKGLAKRMGVDCSKSVTALRKLAAASSGERQRMAHWCANMKAGKNESVNVGSDLTEAESTGWTALEVVESILGKNRVTADDDELVQGMYYVYESSSPPQFEDTEEPGQPGGAIRLRDLNATDPKSIAEAAHEACHAYAHSKSTGGMLYTNEKIINSLAEIWLKKNLSGTSLHFALEHILGSKLHYGADHMARGMPKRMAEARSNPEQNPKPESGMKELVAVAETIADPENWAISMTSEAKLGINPQVGISEDTPKGIYFYPLDYAVDLARRGKKLPWGHDYPYIQLFQYDRSGEMTKETSVDENKLKQALRQYCSDEIIQQALDEPEYDDTPYWFIYDCLSRLGKNDETNVVRWNKVLRDLGFTSVFDPGHGWIAHNEPTQGVVLDPRIIKQLKTISNKKSSGVITPALIEQALFDNLDVELASSRAWQAWDPDGSKLRQHCKEWAKGADFKPWLGKDASALWDENQKLMGLIGYYRRTVGREINNQAWEWYQAQQAQKTESVTEGGWASTATQNTKITPAIIDEAVGILKEFETEFNQWQAQKGLDVEIKMGRPVGSGTYYKRDLAQDPEREYGDVDVMCYIHGREGTGAARRTAEYAAAVEEFTQGHSKYSTSNGTNVIMDTSAGPVQVDLIYTYHEHANWARMLAPEYRVKGVINTSLVSSLAEVLNLSIGVQGVQVKTRAGRPVSFRQSKDTELATVSLDPENWGADIYAYYYELANGTKPKIPANLSKHGGLKDEQRISDIVLTIKSLATDMEQAKLLGAGALDHIANKQDMMQQIARVLDAKFEKVINSSKFDKAATPAAVEKANKTKLMLAKYRNEITKLLLN